MNLGVILNSRLAMTQKLMISIRKYIMSNYYDFKNGSKKGNYILDTTTRHIINIISTMLFIFSACVHYRLNLIDQAWFREHLRGSVNFEVRFYCAM